jgi:hypothetical protein
MLLSLVVKPVFASYHHFGSVSPVSVLEWIYIEVSILQHWEMPSHFDFRRTLPLSVHVLVTDSDSKLELLILGKKLLTRHCQSATLLGMLSLSWFAHYYSLF